MLEIVRARYDEPSRADALIRLLDAFARDPAGGGETLTEFARANPISKLASRPFLSRVLAFESGTAAGRVNAIEGFSTFARRVSFNQRMGFSACKRAEKIGNALFLRKWQ